MPFTKHLKKMKYPRLIALSFFLVIAIGSILLCLPISSKSGEWTNFSDSLFTATSATCVTGLVVVDTYSHWSVFGQLVILTMIQIGGIGLMTLITMLFIVMKKKIGLYERTLLMHSAGNVHLSGMVGLVKRIFKGTIFFELVGACLLFIRFAPQFGVKTGLYYSIFHSVSAFCNAGFDLMGRFSPYSSLEAYSSDPFVCLTICALIIVGGIGFLVWDDLGKNRLKFSHYSLHTKIVISTTLILIAVGTVGFYVFEYNVGLAGMSHGEKILNSFFLSVTMRTAGLATIDLSTVSDSGCILSIILMIIGGSPGSTAGGIKTTTFAVIFFALRSMVKGVNDDVIAFKRRLEDNIVKQASVILVIYITAVLSASMIISFIDNIPIIDVLFESVSAAATVGLFRGVTPDMSVISHLILIILMFGGRIGGFTLLIIFTEKNTVSSVKRPSEKILIG